jgi:phage portal protein BeeE
LGVVPKEINGEPAYQVTENGGTRLLNWRDVIHIPSPSESLFGLVHDARQAIGLALVMEQYAPRLFGPGARPAGSLKFKGKLDAASSTRMKASWQAAHDTRGRLLAAWDDRLSDRPYHSTVGDSRGTP